MSESPFARLRQLASADAECLSDADRLSAFIRAVHEADGRLHDGAALAQAVAQARREALEEAARFASADAAELRCSTSVATAERIMLAIRDLAANPPEDRQTETGGALFDALNRFDDLAFQTICESPVSAAREGYVDGFNNGRIDVCCEVRRLVKDICPEFHALVAAAPPPPALGSLDEECGRFPRGGRGGS